MIFVDVSVVFARLDLTPMHFNISIEPLIKDIASDRQTCAQEPILPFHPVSTIVDYTPNEQTRTVRDSYQHRWRMTRHIVYLSARGQRTKRRSVQNRILSFVSSYENTVKYFQATLIIKKRRTKSKRRKNDEWWYLRRHTSSIFCFTCFHVFFYGYELFLISSLNYTVFWGYGSHWRREFSNM